MQQKKRIPLGVVMAFLLTGNVLAAEPAMTAETEELKQFTLDQVVVTATRDSRRDVDIPASPARPWGR